MSTALILRESVALCDLQLCKSRFRRAVPSRLAHAIRAPPASHHAQDACNGNEGGDREDESLVEGVDHSPCGPALFASDSLSSAWRRALWGIGTRARRARRQRKSRRGRRHACLITCCLHHGFVTRAARRDPIERVRPRVARVERFECHRRVPCCVGIDDRPRHDEQRPPVFRCGRNRALEHVKCSRDPALREEILADRRERYHLNAINKFEVCAKKRSKINLIRPEDTDSPVLGERRRVYCVARRDLPICLRRAYLGGHEQSAHIS
eukprot:5700606-Pleurochrysis_carterae.AAC.4